MVQATVNRILPIIPGEHIFFATNQEYAQLISKQVDTVPARNIIQEPSAKHTAPCIGLAALYMQKLDPNAVMASLHADHFIADEEGFRQALLAAEQVARQGYLVTLGITPNKPETGYGYIQRGAELGQYHHHPVYQVNQFLEKPNLATAERFLASGEYYWNSGIFVWQISTLMQAIQQYQPDLYQKLDQIDKALAAGEAIEPIWQTIQPVSIDVGIMEKALKVAMIPVDIGWNDIGSWDAIYEIGEPDQNNNIIRHHNGVIFNTRNSLIQSSDHRFIATIGLDNIVIVDTGDALLVCAKDHVQDVKKIVTWLEERGRSELL
jgi:mannose-1-phosphate guanylyltransferase